MQIIMSRLRPAPISPDSLPSGERDGLAAIFVDTDRAHGGGMGGVRKGRGTRGPPESRTLPCMRMALGGASLHPGEPRRRREPATLELKLVGVGVLRIQKASNCGFPITLRLGLRGTNRSHAKGSGRGGSPHSRKAQTGLAILGGRGGRGGGRKALSSHFRRRSLEGRRLCGTARLPRRLLLPWSAERTSIPGSQE